MQRFILIFAALFTGLMTGCLYPDASTWKSCRFEIASIEFIGYRENQTEWQITLTVHNPSSDRLKLESLRLFALQGEDTLGTLRNLNPLDLAAKDSTRVALTTLLPKSTWNKLLESLRNEGVAHITISGEAWYRGPFGIRKVPGNFRKTYDLDLATAMNAMGSHLLQGLQGLPFGF